jgi:phospholipid/cholesterol/gamma-HCH transport system permease protein
MGVQSKKSKPYVFSRGMDAFFMEIYAIGQFTGRFFKEAFKPPY